MVAFIYIRKSWLLLPFCLPLLNSCLVLKESPKYQFSEAYYHSRLYHKKKKNLYIVPAEDSIKIYSTKHLNKNIDTTKSIKIAFPLHKKPASFENYTFKKGSFDFDVLNILFKYRPPVHHFPAQFNNNILNAAFYIGKRTDFYKLKYKQSPLGVFDRTITHYGYSIGVFTGFGASRIDEYVTQNAITIQYDGVVHIVGLAAVMALDKVNFGLNVGIDHLLDKNKKVWIYQRKPWLGVSLGLNLN